MLHTVRSKFIPASWGRAFAVTLFFVTLSAGLVWLDFFRSYDAEVTIMVVSRPGNSQNGSDVAKNLAGLTRTLSFYDRVLSDNNLVDDAFDGLTPEERKEGWNDTVSVRKTDEGSILTIKAKGATSQEATLLAKETAQTLFSVAGFYYNVKTDIDLRVIDGPLVQYVLVKPVWFGIVSLLSGFFITAIFFLLLNMAPGYVGKRKKIATLDEILAKQGVSSEKQNVPEKAYPEFALGDTVPWIDPRKFIPAKPTTLSFENVPQEEKKNVVSGVRAPAPANLPIAPNEMDLPVMDEATLPFEFEVSPEELDVTMRMPAFPVRGEHEIRKESTVIEAVKDEQETLTLEEEKKSEPTAEDYKRRLNELLSGSK